MGILNEAQKQTVVAAMKEYFVARNEDGTTPEEVQGDRDKKRVKLIEEILKPLVDKYLHGPLDVGTFKSQNDSLNKHSGYWGFQGVKGQMFFNQVVKCSGNVGELNKVLRAAMAVPSSEDEARSHIKEFERYVRRIGEESVKAGGSPFGKPKCSSIPFFLSYFWQIQNRDVWPVYYTNSVNVMADMNLWQASEDFAEDYVTFKRIHEELVADLSKKLGRSFDFYLVEHLFWYKGGNPTGKDKRVKPEKPTPVPETATLSESYVPPVVAILPKMALNDPALAEAAKVAGTKLEVAFEKHVNAAFTVLGYQTKLLGQGQGRVPDGIAEDRDNAYAILWDAKVRQDGYSIGTDDRTIREYIDRNSRTLGKAAVRNIYYLIVSSTFADDYDSIIRQLKMETGVSEVCLVEAEALVAMVAARLRAPLEVTLGPDGLQRLFSVSGVLRAEDVQQMLG